MNIVQALDLVIDCKRAKRLMGMNAVFPYKPDQFVDACIALQEQIEAMNVKIKTIEMQLRAANARASKLGKPDGP